MQNGTPGQHGDLVDQVTALGDVELYLDLRYGGQGDAPALVYVVTPGRAELDVIEPGRPATTCYTLPRTAVELLTPDQVVRAVLTRIRDVPLPAATRKALAQALSDPDDEIDPTDVGTAAHRRRTTATS